MTSEAGRIQKYFSQLGLEPELADLYLALYEQGPQTVSELARNSKVERTRIYRLMDELKASGLVEVESEYKRNLLKAAPIENVRVLISRREQELRALTTELDQLERLLAPQSLSSPDTRVQLYRGPEGVKQMFWNQTRSTSEVASILHHNMQGHTKGSFFERWVARCNERDLQFRGLIGDVFIKSQQKWYAQHQNERLRNWQSRYLPPSVFSITFGTTIYDDVTSYFNWKNDEIFGVEIYNAEITAAQRQYFELLWKLGQPVDDLTGPPKGVE